MTLIESRPDDRPEHPVDVVERLAAVNEWEFDRAQVDEISILVSGRVANYDVAFTWLAGTRIAACQLFVRPQDAAAQTRGDRRTDPIDQ